MISGAACAAKSESSVQTLRAGRCASSGPVAAVMPARSTIASKSASAIRCAMAGPGAAPSAVIPERAGAAAGDVGAPTSNTTAAIRSRGCAATTSRKYRSGSISTVAYAQRPPGRDQIGYAQHIARRAPRPSERHLCGVKRRALCGVARGPRRFRRDARRGKRQQTQRLRRGCRAFRLGRFEPCQRLLVARRALPRPRPPSPPARQARRRFRASQARRSAPACEARRGRRAAAAPSSCDSSESDAVVDRSLNFRIGVDVACGKPRQREPVPRLPALRLECHRATVGLCRFHRLADPPRRGAESEQRRQMARLERQHRAPGVECVAVATEIAQHFTQMKMSLDRVAVGREWPRDSRAAHRRCGPRG